MVLKLLKENLPWIAPSVAIVLAASGYFDRQSGSETPEPLPSVTATGATVAPADPEQLFRPSLQTTAITPQPAVRAADVSRNVEPTVTISPAVPTQTETAALVPTPTLTDVVPLLGQSPAPVQPRPNAAAALFTPENVVPRVTPDFSSNPAAFFGAAQANLVGDNPCVDDLKALARDTKIYFPSGGLTGEDAGMAQARLIGVIAQNCPGVTIQVEGHSDPSGDPRVNLRLSQQRADSVLSRMAAAGIDMSKFVAVGMGDRRSAARNQAPIMIVGSSSPSPKRCAPPALICPTKLTLEPPFNGKSRLASPGFSGR